MKAKVQTTNAEGAAEMMITRKTQGGSNRHNEQQNRSKGVGAGVCVVVCVCVYRWQRAPAVGVGRTRDTCCREPASGPNSADWRPFGSSMGLRARLDRRGDDSGSCDAKLMARHTPRQGRNRRQQRKMKRKQKGNKHARVCERGESHDVGGWVGWVEHGQHHPVSVRRGVWCVVCGVWRMPCRTHLACSMVALCVGVNVATVSNKKSAGL